MRSMFVSVMLGLVVVISVAAVVLAWTNGATNGQDNPPWASGVDNPGGEQGTYCYQNLPDKQKLLEWEEPGHDWFRSELLNFDAAAEQTLNAWHGQRFLSFEQVIVNQFYYQYAGAYITNAPHTSAAAKGGAEEAFQGYSEFDMELRTTADIDAGVNYFLTVRYDAEIQPLATQPRFEASCEWEDSLGGLMFRREDPTGKFTKHVLIK